MKAWKDMDWCSAAADRGTSIMKLKDWQRTEVHGEKKRINLLLFARLYIR